MTDDEVQALIEKQKEEQQEKETEEETTVEEEVDPELLEAQQNMAQYASAEPITTDGNVYNIMLVGLDTTDKGWIGNSDSMILISVNYRLEQISMISLMRDTHVMIPGIGYRKLNATYPNGGGPLLVKTVEENYKIDVDRYVTVDFGSMIDIIDEIGTIEITFTPKEAENANKSIKQQCRILGLKSNKYLIPGEGTYECNGMQAVAYARIRKVGNSDYQRTERQREVLLKLLDKVKAMSFEDLDRLATRLLPLLTHNVPESEFWGLLAKAPTLMKYKIISDRIPYDGMYHGYNGDLVPDWEPTVRKLKETIYLSLIDHIDGAIERYENQIQFANPLLWEIKQYYPSEFKVGVQSLNILKKMLGIELPVDEAAFIALHFITAEYDTKMDVTFDIPRLIDDIIAIVESEFSIKINKESIHYERFITHLKFFAARVLQAKQMPDDDDFLFRNMIRDQYKKSYACAQMIRQHLGECYKVAISEEEVVYLTVHIKRVTMHVD